MVSWRINSTKISYKQKLNKMEKSNEQAKTKPCTIHGVVGSVFRPKDGHDLLRLLKEKKKCEIVDTHAFLAAKMLEDNECGFSFSFKKSNWNKGWTSFERC